MTLHREANQNSHYAIFPALGRDIVSCTRRLSGHSVSTTRHSANGIASCVGPQLDHARGATKVDHCALLCRDETSRHDVHSARRGCAAGFGAETIVFHGGVASWCVSQDGGLVPGEERRGSKTGPKMDPKNFEMGTEKSCSVTLRGSRDPAAPNISSSSAPAARARPPSDGCPVRAALPAMRSALWSQTSWCAPASDRAPRCAGALRVRSRELRRVEGVASCPLPNRARCRRLGLGERFEQVFEEIHKPNDCRNSAASVSRSGPTRSQTLSWRSAWAARSARHNSTSPAIESRLTKRSWQCSTSCGPASGLEEYPRGVRYSSQGSLRKGRKHLGADDRSLAALSARLAFLSSGDGLGIHQPGSMTRGTRAKVQTPSGRARLRAMCPAVARFNQGRAA